MLAAGECPGVFHAWPVGLGFCGLGLGFKVVQRMQVVGLRPAMFLVLSTVSCGNMSAVCNTLVLLPPPPLLSSLLRLRLLLLLAFFVFRLGSAIPSDCAVLM